MNRLACLFLVALWATHPLAAQTDPSRQLELLREQIAADERRLENTREAEAATVGTLRELERSITTREALVATQVQRMRQLQLRRDTLAASLSTYQREADDLREQYQRRAIHAYKRGRLNDLALILSAGSVNQMVRRVVYLRHFAEQRRRRLSSIEGASVAAQRQRSQISESVAEAEQLLIDAQRQQQQLRQLQRERQGVVRELQSARSEIERALQQRRDEVARIERQIRQAIAEERVEREQAPDPVAAEAEAVRLSGSFSSNRGRLPWPVRGVVTETYGEHTNQATGTKTPHPGLFIASTEGVPVRAVFEGTVRRVEAWPSFGSTVFLSHGDYWTVYANFSSVSVSVGDEVAAGQTIGRAGTASQPLGAGLFFAVFVNGRDVDPAPWLQR
jgi:septal ring factor EnvC (AmiA/AmiB activator)